VERNVPCAKKDLLAGELVKEKTKKRGRGRNKGIADLKEKKKRESTTGGRQFGERKKPTPSGGRIISEVAE